MKSKGFVSRNDDINYNDVWKRVQRRSEITGESMAEILWKGIAALEHEDHERENEIMRAKLERYNKRCVESQ